MRLARSSSLPKSAACTSEILDNMSFGSEEGLEVPGPQGRGRGPNRNTSPLRNKPSPSTKSNFGTAVSFSPHSGSPGGSSRRNSGTVLNLNRNQQKPSPVRSPQPIGTILSSVYNDRRESLWPGADEPQDEELCRAPDKDCDWELSLLPKHKLKPKSGGQALLQALIPRASNDGADGVGEETGLEEKDYKSKLHKAVSKINAVGKLMQFKDDKIVNHMQREEQHVKKLRTRIEVLEGQLTQKDQVALSLRLKLQNRESEVEDITQKLKLALIQVDTLQAQIKKGRDDGNMASAQQMEQIANYYEKKCKQLQQRLLVLGERAGMRYAPLWNAAQRLAQEHRSLQESVRTTLQNTLQDVVFAMNNVPLPELPEPPPIVIEPPPSPPSPPSVPKTPAIPREKLLELEKLIQAFSNSLKRMQKDVHIEDMEDPAHKLQSPSNEGEGEDALARFDRALNVLRDFDMQLQDCSNQVTARLLAIDVESNARQLEELEGQNGKMQAEILGLVEQLNEHKTMLQAAQTAAEQRPPTPPPPPETTPAPESIEIGVDPFIDFTKDWDGYDPLAMRSFFSHQEAGDELRALAAQADELMKESDEQPPHPPPPKPTPKKRIKESERHAIEALQRWQHKRMELMQRRQKILLSGRHIIRSWMMDGTRNIAAAPVQAPQRSPSDPSVEFRPTTPPQPNNLSHGSHFGLPVHTVTSSQFAQHMHHGHHAHHAPNAVHQRTSGDRGRSKSTESNRQGPWVLSQNSGGNSAARVHVSSLHFGTTHGSRAATPVAERGGSSEGFRSLTGTSHGSRAATPVADRSLSSEGLMSLAVNVSNSSRPRSPQPHTGGAPHGSPGHVNSPGPRSPPRSPHAQQRGKVQEMSAREFAIINAGTGALPPLPGPAGRQKVRHG